MTIAGARDDLVPRLITLLRIATGHVHVGAASGQLQHRLSAEAGVAPGDDDHFAIDAILFCILAALDEFSDNGRRYSSL